MNKNLSFDTPQVEQSFKNGVFVRNFDIIKFTMMLNLIISAYKIISQINDIYWLISLMRILITFLILFISMAFMNLNKLETSHNIRWLMEINIIINIIIQSKFINYDELRTSNFNGNVNGNINDNANGNFNSKYITPNYKCNNFSFSNSTLSLTSLSSNLIFEFCRFSHLDYLDIFPTCNLNEFPGNSMSNLIINFLHFLYFFIFFYIYLYYFILYYFISPYFI
jgi:hypothetical protein